jgi:single-stranded DNA-binding protein
LRQESWDDKESGKKRSRVSIVASDVTFLDGPSGDSDASAPASPSSSPKNKDVTIDDIDDKPIDLSEIPF